MSGPGAVARRGVWLRMSGPGAVAQPGAVVVGQPARSKKPGRSLSCSAGIAQQNQGLDEGSCMSYPLALAG
eukprot:353202-Chlamydomonas_euryale.AAC.1